MANRSRGQASFRRMFSPTRRSASAAPTDDKRQQRRKRQARRWRERFRAFALSSWQSSRIVQGVCELFRSSAETARALRGATGTQFVGLGNRSLRIESLEQRQLLAADIWVNNNWNLIADNGTVGVVDQGDIVKNDNDSVGAGTIIKTYGVDGFGTVTTGLATGSN